MHGGSLASGIIINLEDETILAHMQHLILHIRTCNQYNDYYVGDMTYNMYFVEYKQHHNETSTGDQNCW